MDIIFLLIEVIIFMAGIFVCTLLGIKAIDVLIHYWLKSNSWSKIKKWWYFSIGGR